jgi:hypothetical protein
MSEKTITDWRPEEDLTGLLDALTEELFIVRDDEIAACTREMGEACGDVAQAMRRLVAAADAELMLPPVSNFAAAALRIHPPRQ